MFPRNRPGWGDAGSSAGRGEEKKEKATPKRTQEPCVNPLKGDPRGGKSAQRQQLCALSGCERWALCLGSGTVRGEPACPWLGKDLGATLLCATSAERERSAPRGPLRPFPTPSVVLSVAGTPAGFPPSPSLRRSFTTGPGQASPPQRDRGPQDRPPPPWDAMPAPGEAPRGKHRVLGCPGSWLSPRASLELPASLGVHSGVSAPFLLFPPLFLLFPPPRIIKTLVVTLTAGNDNYLNLDHGSDPCYR